MTRPTIADRLDRAAELGRARAVIDQDPAWHRLSREAWQRCCVELGGLKNLEALEAIALEIATKWPNLSHEVELLARRWADRGQDRPAVAPLVFGAAAADRFPAAYTERLAAGLSDDQCSAVAAMRCAELRSEATFGRLDDWSELDQALAPIDAELAQLDQVIAAELRVADLDWHQGRPVLSRAGAVVQVGPDTLQSCATLIATLVARPVPLDLAA